MEFQAVVMAAGRGSRMTDLTARIAKPMLPIANKPMVWYPIKLLEDAGFTDAIVVVSKSACNDLIRVLKELTTTIQLDFVTIPDDHDTGTIDTLRLIRNKITSDLLVISGDLVTSFPLHLLADVFRTNDATITMLLAPAPDISLTPVPKGNASRRIERDLIGLDRNHKRVLYCTSESDLEEFITFKLSDLDRHPYMDIHTKLVDAHLYLMKKRVIDIIINDDDVKSQEMTMIKGDLIPYLVRRQYTDTDASVLDAHNSSSILNGSEASQGSNGSDSKRDDQSNDATSMELLARSLSSWSDTDQLSPRHRSSRHLSQFSSVSSSHHQGQEPVRCYAHVLDGSTMCLRANTLVTYCEANRQIAKEMKADSPITSQTSLVQLPKSSHVSSDSLLGTSLSIAEKVNIKCSVVGNHCVIGEKTKITNCIIMDHVNIRDGVTLTGCVVCESASITDKAELKDCLVGVAQAVTSGKFTNEIMLERDQMMEI